MLGLADTVLRASGGREAIDRPPRGTPRHADRARLHGYVTAIMEKGDAGRRKQVA